MRRAEAVLALQQCCGCVVRRFTSNIGGGVVSEEACKWNCPKQGELWVSSEPVTSPACPTMKYKKYSLERVHPRNSS